VLELARVAAAESTSRAGQPEACSSRSRTVTASRSVAAPFAEERRHRLVEPQRAVRTSSMMTVVVAIDFGERREIEGGLELAAATTRRRSAATRSRRDRRACRPRTPRQENTPRRSPRR
jgi:hypothetical protein